MLQENNKKIFYDDIEVGEQFISGGRTITETDIVNFAGLSGDFNPLHIDEEYMKKTLFGKRIAHGLLILSIQSGLVRPDISVIAFLGISEWNFRKPVFIGDTIHVRLKVIEKRETSKIDRGIIVWKREIYNQKKEIVQEGKTLVMINRNQQ